MTYEENVSEASNQRSATRTRAHRRIFNGCRPQREDVEDHKVREFNFGCGTGNTQHGSDKRSEVEHPRSIA